MRALHSGAEFPKGRPTKADNCSLAVDWDAIGLDPDRTVVLAPHVPSWQPASSYRIGPPPERLVGPIPVTAWRGRLVLLADETEAAKLPPQVRMVSESGLTPQQPGQLANPQAAGRELPQEASKAMPYQMYANGKNGKKGDRRAQGRWIWSMLYSPRGGLEAMRKFGSHVRR